MSGMNLDRPETSNDTDTSLFQDWDTYQPTNATTDRNQYDSEFPDKKRSNNGKLQCIKPSAIKRQPIPQQNNSSTIEGKVTTMGGTPPPLPLRPPAVPKRTRINGVVANSATTAQPPSSASAASYLKIQISPTPAASGSNPKTTTNTPATNPLAPRKFQKARTSPPMMVVPPLIKSRQCPPAPAQQTKGPTGVIATNPSSTMLNSSTLSSQTILFGGGSSAATGAQTNFLDNTSSSSSQNSSTNTSVTSMPSYGKLGGKTCSDTAVTSTSTTPSTNPQLQKSTSNSKISIRQDSNVSSDSFSQTSSPSYTTKTMETPLLPNHHPNSKLYNGALRNHSHPMTTPAATLKIDASANSGKTSDGNDCNANGSSITKSVSTPASLQTIVRFHNGSNMSLHHRIIRDMRRPSGPYGSTVRVKFRFAQVLINAIALLAISGGLAAYFRAYPSSVQVITANISKHHNNNEQHSGGIASNNPAPGICLPVIVNFCINHKVPYNFTIFPNYMGHFSQRDAQQELEVYDAVVDVRCYELAALFLCSVFVPKCGTNGQVVRPCRSLCFETKRRCGFFLDVFGLSLPDYLECGLFPESTDPEICVGHKEVKEAKLRAQKPVCTSGFKCDIKRCIPGNWQCDGHVDCKDQSDELNCKQCGKGMIHCGDEHCMAQEHMCDGVIDCPWGQDELNCLRLSDANGDEGHGQLEVFLPEQQQWVPACVTRWDPVHSANEVCSLLGYTASNWTSQNLNNDFDISPPTRELSSTRKIFKSKTSLVKEFRSCAGNMHQSVNLTCTGFGKHYHYQSSGTYVEILTHGEHSLGFPACGKIRKHYKHKVTKRIVGGAESAPGDWPFLAALLGGPEEVFYCAGVLIADQWILTASHCVGNHSDVSGWTIQLGITRRHSHTYYAQKMKVRRVVPHPMYNLEVAHDNDVALFQLASKVTFHEHLLPVCLPPPNRELVPGTVCTVIGWGKREDKGMSEYEPAVNEVRVPVLNRELCNQWLEHRDLNVTEGMICAGFAEGGKDACQGDSGGPLLCQDDNDPEKWFVGGIVSWGIKCAHPNLPGVYAYVPRYISWITQQMAYYSNSSIN